MIFVVAFGIGPFAGFLALTLHTIGAMGKLYAEANENIDERQLEGVRASGGNWFEVIRFAVLPQVLPNFTTYTLWRLELNIRSAAIVGFVGAGGIGQELYHAISFNYYEDVSAIVLMVVATIMVIDLICERLRHRDHRQGTLAMRLGASAIDPAQIACAPAALSARVLAHAAAARGMWRRSLSAWLHSSCSASSDLTFRLPAIMNGLDRFGKIAGALFPPTPGDAFWELLQGHAGEHRHGISWHADRQHHRGSARLPRRAQCLPIWLFRFPIRRSFDFLRGVDALVWALVFVRAVGLGPLAGVLAIATTDIGILSKLFAEAIENVDRKQVDGVQATGANAVQRVRFGIIPQVLPIMVSNALYMFESNARSATILGHRGRRRNRLSPVRPHPRPSLGGGRLHHHHDHRVRGADRFHFAPAAKPADQGGSRSALLLETRAGAIGRAVDAGHYANSSRSILGRRHLVAELAVGFVDARRRRRSPAQIRNRG